MRVNKVVELLESRQPAYFEFVEGAASWAQLCGAVL